MGNTLGRDTSDTGRGPSKQATTQQATTTSALPSDFNNLSFGRSNDFTEATRLKATFPVGTQVEIGGASFVVLDYYRDPQNKDTVLLGIPGETERLSRFEVNALKHAKHVQTLDPETCNLMLKTQEAKSLALTFAHRVRCERREDPNATPIPFLRNKPELRYDLFKAIAPILAPQLVQGKVEDATILALVRDFFDRRLPPQKQHEAQPAQPNLRHRHIHFPDAPTESGRIEFEDTLVPVTVEGLDGHPVQVVTREFVTAELEKRCPESDTVPLRLAEVKAWLRKNVEPYPMRVILHGEQSSNAGQAYLLSDVLIALRDQPVRTQVPRLDESGRARIDVAGVPTEVVSLGALCSYREVPGDLVGDLLARLQIDPVAGVELRENVLERKHKVYPAETA